MIFKQLSSGCNSQVFSTHVDGQEFVVKIPKTDYAKKSLRKEFDTLKALEKRNFHSPKAFAYNDKGVVMERLYGKTLSQCLKTMNAKEVTTVVKETAKMLCLLHSYGFSHPDATPKNIIISKNGLYMIDWQGNEQNPKDVANMYFGIKESFGISDIFGVKGKHYALLFLQEYLDTAKVDLTEMLQEMAAVQLEFTLSYKHLLQSPKQLPMVFLNLVKSLRYVQARNKDIVKEFRKETT
jgi:predicted Ser/Thr protein kinase